MNYSKSLSFLYTLILGIFLKLNMAFAHISADDVPNEYSGKVAHSITFPNQDDCNLKNFSYDEATENSSYNNTMNSNLDSKSLFLEEVHADVSFSKPKNSAIRIFFKQWLKNPLQMGSVRPSSLKLAEMMCSNIDFAGDSYVIDLGAGTGVFSDYLLNKGFKSEKLILIEKDPNLCTYLKEKFANRNLKIIEGDAKDLVKLTQEHLKGEKVDHIISGLPCRAFPREMVLDIYEVIFKVLSPTGKVYQFTYAPLFKPVSKTAIRKEKNLDINSKFVGRVFSNFPFGYVYSYGWNQKFSLTVSESTNMNEEIGTPKIEILKPAPKKSWQKRILRNPFSLKS